MTQFEIVKTHLEKYHTITSMEAFQRYKITRISAVIYNLRDSGLKIVTEYETTKNIYGERTTYGVYRLVKEHGGQ